MSTRPTNYKEKHITKMIESRYWKEELSRIVKTTSHFANHVNGQNALVALWNGIL